MYEVGREVENTASTGLPHYFAPSQDGEWEVHRELLGNLPKRTCFLSVKKTKED